MRRLFLFVFVVGLLAAPAAPSAAAVPSGAPTLVRSVASADTVTVTWGPPTRTGGAPVTGYRIARDGTDSTGGGPYATSVRAASRTFTFTLLRPGYTYAMTVQAITRVGTGRAAIVRVTTKGAGLTMSVAITPIN